MSRNRTRAIKGPEWTLVNNKRLDDDPTEFTSEAFNVQDYSRGLLGLTIDSTSSPTDVQFQLLFSNTIDGTFSQLVTGFEGDIRYEDTATATAVTELLDVNLPGKYVKVKAVGTGTDATNYFDVTVTLQPYAA